MKANPPRGVPDEAAATPAEIEAAIEGLTLADWARVRRYADFRMVGLGLKADGRTGEDLRQTALTDLLKGTRRWNKDKVGFVMFLTGAMRSISSNWARSYKPEDTAMVEADSLRENEEGEVISPFDNLTAKNPNPEEQLRDRQTLKLIDNLFIDDEEAQQVLMAWQDRLVPAEVRELWGLSQNEYNTVVRRIRRTIAAAGLTANRDRRRN